jgi:predicted CXXCH cytochrome family protein
MSVHGDEGCKDCHGDPYVTVPHVANSRWQIKSCPECHKSAKRQNVPEFQDTLHFKNHPDNFNCESCHNPHTLEAAKTLGTGKRLVAQDNGMCLDCHGSDQRYAQYSAKPRPELAVIHQWLPNPELHWKAARCIDCHTPGRENGSTSHVILGKDKAVKDCTACHNATSSLRTRLYRHFSDQGLEKAGFLNGAVLSEAYVVGATRNRWLDEASWVITGLLLAGLIGHAGVRLIAFRRRNRRK